jgi:hypothetical protein
MYIKKALDAGNLQEGIHKLLHGSSMVTEFQIEASQANEACIQVSGELTALSKVFDLPVHRC